MQSPDPDNFDWKSLYDRGWAIDHPVTPDMVHTGMQLKQSIKLTATMGVTWLSLLTHNIDQLRRNFP